MFDNVVKQNKRISSIEPVISSHEDRIRLLEYKSIDLEARSHRNNYLFYGLKENRLEDCKDIICQFVSVELNVSISVQDISRAHRVGRFDRRRERPIIVAFDSNLTTDSIIKQGFRLKDSVYCVARLPIRDNSSTENITARIYAYEIGRPISKDFYGVPCEITSEWNSCAEFVP